MTDLLSAVKRDLAHLKCAVHGESPKITGSGDKLNMTACCDEFGKVVQAKMKKSADDFMKKSINDVFKNLGKRR